MNILVTINSAYLLPLCVMLESLFLNNPGEKFQICLLHGGLKPSELDGLDRLIGAHGSRFLPRRVDDACFDNAPLLFYYTKETYFRLLAARFLPPDLDRILYLDPDLLILNPVRELYETNLDEWLFAAAYHNKLTITEINKLRLHPYNIDAYYNSGVLLMNLKRLRNEVDEGEIARFIAENRMKLVMPDQDILNSLYSHQIRPLDELRYNYDARFYSYYKLAINGRFDMDRILNETVVLHFCGKKKPWRKRYSGMFLSLYKHYQKQATQALLACGVTPPPAAERRVWKSSR